MLCTDCLSVLGQPKVNPLPILSKGGRAGQNQYHYKLRHRHTRNIQALLALEASTLRAHSPHFINSMLTKQAKTIMAGGATNSTYIGHGVCFLHGAANNKAWSTSRSLRLLPSGKENTTLPPPLCQGMPSSEHLLKGSQYLPHGPSQENARLRSTGTSSIARHAEPRGTAWHGVVRGTVPKIKSSEKMHCINLEFQPFNKSKQQINGFIRAQKQRV